MRTSGMRLVSLVLAVTSYCSNLELAKGVSYGSCTTGASYYCPSMCNGSYIGDCLSCEGYTSSDRAHEICIDRRLFQPYNADPNDNDDHYHFLWNDLVAAIVWFFTAGISIACGVGGGGVYVPLGIVLLQFAPKQASGLSQASIFGAGLSGLILNSSIRHPVEKIRHDAGTPDQDRRLAKQRKLSKAEEETYIAEGGKFYTRPVINYDMALFMSPAQMAGAVIGLLVQRVLPNWMYLLIAAVVLSYTSYETYKKYFSVRKTETGKCHAAEEAAKASPPQEDIAIDSAECDNQTHKSSEEFGPFVVQAEGAFAPAESRVEDGYVFASKSAEQSLNDEKLELRIQYLEQDMRQYPLEKIGALLLLWIGIFVFTLLQGGKGIESLLGIQCDSAWYYVLIVLQFLWVCCFAVFFGQKLKRDQDARIAVDYPYLGKEDAAWDMRSIRVFGIFCFLSGIVSALIGIAGGMVLGPILLMMGIDPRVATATNCSMIVVTSSSIAFMAVTSGLVPWSYAIFYFCITFTGAWVLKRQIDAYVKRTGRASLLIFVLATIIAIAIVGCFVSFFTGLSAKGWCFDDFQPLCTTSNGEDCPVDRMLGLVHFP